MSSVSTIYDAWQSLITTNISDIKQLRNPYIPEDNPALFLNKGYGIVYGPGTNTNRFVNCKQTIERNFDIIFSRRVTTTELNQDQLEVLQKAIMEDQATITNKLETDPTLAATTIKTVYDSDTGLEYLDVQDQKYFVIVTTFLSEYLETL